jgi:hypothetical protein
VNSPATVSLYVVPARSEKRDCRVSPSGCTDSRAYSRLARSITGSSGGAGSGVGGSGGVGTGSGSGRVGGVAGRGSLRWYQLVSPRPPARDSEMCTWLRCRSDTEHFFFDLQPGLR